MEAAIERICARRPDLRFALQLAADILTGGEDEDVDVDMIHQAAVQQFLWWELPRKCPEEDLLLMVDATAELLDELGLTRLAKIARSDTTTAILDAWAVGYDEAAVAFRKAYESSGVEPPDTDILEWGSVMGAEEAMAFDAVERALGEAISSGKLVPGSTGWKSVAKTITEKVLTDPLELPPGQTLAGLVTTERVSNWVNSSRQPLLASWRTSVANRILNPIQAPSNASEIVAPFSWLLELASAKGGALLTASNYLAPASVREAVERFGWWDFEGAPRSEVEVHALSTVRSILSRLHLVRRSGRRLHITKRGSQLLEEPARLWQALAAQTEENDEYSETVTELVGLRLLLGGRVVEDELVDDVRTVLTDQGWATSEGPITSHQTSYAIWGPLRYWRLLSVLDEEQSTWEAGTFRRLTPHILSLRPEGELLVLGYLRARAAGSLSQYFQ